VGGAGKGVLVDVILNYFAGTRITSINPQNLSNNFNSWMATTDWAQLDDATDGATVKEKLQLVGELKRLTGSATINIERKGKDLSEPQRHFVTPIVSTNTATKLITDTTANDRRLVVFLCRKPLTDITDDTREFIAKIIDDLPHFAYYLANLPTIAYNDYTGNKDWKNKDYEAYIEDTMSLADKLLEAATLGDTAKFVQELQEANVSYDDIDSMFSTTVEGKPGRILLYNTASTKSLGIQSLQDIAEINSQINTNIKHILRPLKQGISYARGAGKNIKIQVVEFKDLYKPFNKPLDPIEFSENIEL